MLPKKPTTDEEASFMADLLGGCDDTSLTLCSSPFKTEVQENVPIPRTPTKHKTDVKPVSRDEVKLEDSEAVDGADLSVNILVRGAEDWDWDDMEYDFLTPKKAKPIRQNVTPELQYTPEPCTRCTVDQVQESSLNGRCCKTLTVITEPTKCCCSIVLCDEWSQSDVRIGDTVNVIGKFERFTASSSSSPEATISVTSKANYFIHHPDILLTATAIANAPQCRRKPILSSLVRSTSDVTPALVWGNMLHEVMQACLSHNKWEERWIDERIDEVVRKGLGELVKIGMDVNAAKREVKGRAKGLQTFAARYMSQVPKADAILTNTRASENQKSLLAISKLHDVEEDIWSPTWGLKGKLDASVQAIIEERASPFAKPETKSYPMPLELKTGRVVAGMEHRAQTMLYTLLMAERYKSEVPSGLLFYTHTEEVVRVPAARLELKGLILARNEIACYMMQRHRMAGIKKEDRIVKESGETAGFESFLPPTIDDERTCKRCYALDTCMLFRKAVENVEDHSSPIADVYALKTSHLTPSQLDFFKKWEGLISLEEEDLVRFRKELWTLTAKERETKGRCFANMVMDTSYRPSPPLAAGQKESRIHQHTYRFVRKSEKETTSLLNGHMSHGDAVTISVEPDLLALTRGFITELTPTEVVVGVDHDLNVDTILSQTKAPGRVCDPFGSAVGVDDRVVFRIDRDELFSGMGRIRDNLAQMFYVDGDTRRLQLAVDLRPPEFEDTMDDESSALVSNAKHLNDHQKAAMEKVMTAHDYALILGMPGTGKTTIIATLITALVSLGRTVLLTSYTHSAVDNIILKLKGNVDFGILRLGNVDKVHPDVQEFTSAARQRANTVEQLEHQLITPPVVATTCLSIDNVAAKRGGLDVSLFRRLSDAHPHAVVDLGYQYRMNSDIMLLSNKLIYGDRLRCGSEEVARRSLQLPNTKILKAFHRPSCYPVESCWLHKLMAESCKAVFVDTDAVPACDTRVGDLVQNEVEAKLVHQTTDALLAAGISEDQIGIISLYRQQIKLLSHLLQSRKNIEILTADRSQGRDKDCIIISMVRSNGNSQIGELIRDWRRMNVSFTRARSKLIIFGSRKTLQTAPLLAEFFDLMDKQGWILTLPPKADTLHRTLDTSVSSKRSVESFDTRRYGKENDIETNHRPAKKIKHSAEDGVLKGRPLLRDLVNGYR
ncbi:Dna2-domain-containing protein [Neolentinus lepideus HHB14362 ss-1]|uniref:DNA replication ATP-dependent helicase/nuclease n=1 Tax=Neolentinus lepideus HHB14362 ss-1 TaxID=1314782 RepID=A0A165PKI7_9AGAM|nr:Dna2-domain-containing protein [Neolentinus lepideus HHB14362 ss-1]